jgi:hypothetical protein
VVPGNRQAPDNRRHAAPPARRPSGPRRSRRPALAGCARGPRTRQPGPVRSPEADGQTARFRLLLDTPPQTVDDAMYGCVGEGDLSRSVVLPEEPDETAAALPSTHANPPVHLHSERSAGQRMPAANPYRKAPADVDYGDVMDRIRRVAPVLAPPAKGKAVGGRNHGGSISDHVGAIRSRQEQPSRGTT